MRSPRVRSFEFIDHVPKLPFVKDKDESWMQEFHHKEMEALFSKVELNKSQSEKFNNKN